MAINERKKEYNREVYYWLKEHHICTYCKNEDAEPNRTYCAECRIKESKRKKEYYKKHPDKYIEQKKKVKENNKKRYYERKENGICTSCGKYKIYQKSETLCMDCYFKSRRYFENRKKNKLDRNERPNYNMCYICGKTGLYSDKLCKNCFERESEKMKKQLENPTVAMLVARKEFCKKGNVFFQNRRVNYGTGTIGIK